MQCERTGTSTMKSTSALRLLLNPPRTSSASTAYFTDTYTPWYVSVSLRPAIASTGNSNGSGTPAGSFPEGAISMTVDRMSMGLIDE